MKIFYYENKWITIQETKHFEIYFKKTFNNIKDIYEILNKDYYYTYFIRNEKLNFVSKGKMKDIKQIYGCDGIFLENNEYIFIKKIENDMKNKYDKKCKDILKCINPKFQYIHPREYDINISYKEY